MAVDVQQLCDRIDSLKVRQEQLEETCSWQWRRITHLTNTAPPGATTTATHHIDNNNIATQSMPTQAHAQALVSLATSNAEVARLRTLLGTKTREFEDAMEAMRCSNILGEDARIALTRALGTLHDEILAMQNRQDVVERALATREENVTNREAVVASREEEVTQREEGVVQREVSLEAKEQEVNSIREELTGEATVTFFEYIVDGWTLHAEEGGGGIKTAARCIHWFRKAVLLKYIKDSDAAIAWSSIGYMLSPPDLDPNPSTTTITPSSSSSSKPTSTIITTVEIKGVHYNKPQCYIRALELDPKNGSSWNNIAAYYYHIQQPVVKVGDATEYTITELCIKALEADADLAVTWASLGAAMETYGEDDNEENVEGGTSAGKCVVVVSGQEYTQHQCFQKALGLNPTDALTWLYAGKSLVLTSDMTTATTSAELATSSTSTVVPQSTLQPVFQLGDAYYTKQQCFLKALELVDDAIEKEGIISNDEENIMVWVAAPVWFELYAILQFFPATIIPTITTIPPPIHSSGNDDANVANTITIKEVMYNARQCLIMALELDPRLEHAWDGLAIMLATHPSHISKPLHNDDDNNQMAAPASSPSSSVIAKEEGGKNVLGGMTAQDCFYKVLELNPDNSMAWYHLGNTILPPSPPQTKSDIEGVSPVAPSAIVEEEKVVVVGKLSYNKLQCYIKSVEIDDTRAAAWYNTGIAIQATYAATTPTTTTTTTTIPSPTLTYSTVEINGDYYTKLQCFVKALSVLTDEESAVHNFATLWYNTGTEMQKQQQQTTTTTTTTTEEVATNATCASVDNVVITIRGETFTAQQCWDRALVLDPLVVERFTKREDK